LPCIISPHYHHQRNYGAKLQERAGTATARNAAGIVSHHSTLVKRKTGRSRMVTPRPSSTRSSDPQTNPVSPHVKPPQIDQDPQNEAKCQIGTLWILTHCPSSQSTSYSSPKNWLRLVILMFVRGEPSRSGASACRATGPAAVVSSWRVGLFTPKAFGAARPFAAPVPPRPISHFPLTIAHVPTPLCQRSKYNPPRIYIIAYLRSSPFRWPVKRKGCSVGNLQRTRDQTLTVPCSTKRVCSTGEMYKLSLDR